VTRAGALTLSRAWDVCERLTTSIAAARPDLAPLEAAGDLRRAEPLVRTIVLVGAADDPANAIASIASFFGSQNIRERSGTGMAGLYERASVEIRIASPDEYGNVLFSATGSAAHVEALARRGFRGGRFATESQLYASVGLPFIPPELRHGADELDAAAANQLPSLLDVDHMRGDLHMHSTYSDGRDPVDIMLGGCHALGYEYVAMTDHSSGAMAARTLAYDEIARQREDIDALRDRFSGMTILHGVEVDILPDGRLDFADHVLERFDIVLASLHDHHGHDPRRLTARSLAAIRHPLVNILCHPANRAVGHSEGYALDFDALYEAAAEHGTALEIDGAPMHMDLDSDRARAAVAAGVTLTVDSDCHRVEGLGRQMRFGVGLARRGWVGPEHVLNTRPLDQVLAFIAAKRRGRPLHGHAPGQ
jgi:DNA polymerase (family 10)